MKKIAIIVQRYGQEVSGGGEFYAKALAEHLKERYDVTVLTTTSLEYMDWDQYYPSGEGEIDGVRVLRFRNQKGRDWAKFQALSDELCKTVRSGGQTSPEKDLEWADAEGPYCPDLVKYVEKHYGSGDGRGSRIMNPETVVEVGENSFMEMETVQIKGVDSTRRSTRAKLADGARLVVTEKLMTHGAQTAETSFHVDLDGKDSSANIISRSVARDDSRQLFLSKIKGNSRCKGHSECDGIIMDRAVISAVPEITAADLDAELIHEAAIGKIAGDQLVKLMTLGLTEAEAEAQIVNGFLK